MIFKVVARARRRLLWNALAGEGARAVSAGMGALVLLLIFGTEILSWRWIWVVPSITFAAGVCIAVKRRPDAYDAAQRIDSRLRLADTLSTAVFFWPATPSRRCHEGARLGQRERAAEVAAGVDLRAALPLRIPRSTCAFAAGLALLAGGLFMLRYHFAGRIDLRAPASAAIMQLLREAKTEVVKLEKVLETPAPDKADGNSEQADAKASEKADGDAAVVDDSGKVEGASGGENKMEKPDRPKSSPDREQAENRQPGTEQEGSDQNASAKRAGGAEQRPGDQSSGRQAADQEGSSSSLFSKISDIMANLASALKPQANAGQAKDGDRTPASGTGMQQRESGTGTSQSAQGSASRSAEQTADANQANGSMSATGESSNPPGEQRPGSGAGREEGNKQIKLAEQLEATGKISVILGKRSKDLTGTAYAEVTSGPQELKTAYEARKAEHADVRARADRDEIPLEFQNYVEQYFREMRKADPRAVGAGKRR